MPCVEAYKAMPATPMGINNRATIDDKINSEKLPNQRTGLVSLLFRAGKQLSSTSMTNKIVKKILSRKLASVIYLFSPDVAVSLFGLATLLWATLCAFSV